MSLEPNNAETPDVSFDREEARAQIEMATEQFAYLLWEHLQLEKKWDGSQKVSNWDKGKMVQLVSIQILLTNTVQIVEWPADDNYSRMKRRVAI